MSNKRNAMLGLVCALSGAVHAADWPAYRHDAQRSAITAEKLSFPLRLAWRHTAAQPPAPAWPPTPRTLNQMVFDYAAHPVVAGGLLYYGSSSDDTLRALDAATGAERWHFVAGGPIRFAPAFARSAGQPEGSGGRVYFASDDGLVYCLEAATGKPVWTFRAAPSDERLLGDGRMVSRWPCRNGVLVDSGVVYVVAGMWPTEGVFVYALDAATGAVLWCHDTSGYPAPWEDFKSLAFFYSGMSPQGPLMATRDALVVPTGRSSAAALDRRTGQLLRLHPGQKGSGGGYPLTVSGDSFAAYLVGKKGQPWLVQSIGIRRGGGAKFNEVPQPALLTVPNPEDDAERHLMTGLSLILTKDRFYVRRAFELALAGETLIAGEADSVAAYEAKLTSRAKKSEPGRYDPETQSLLWRAPVHGLAYGLAVADGRLYVATDQGEISCFASREVAHEATIRDQSSAVSHPSSTISARTLTADHRSLVTSALRAAGADLGYALIAGDTDGRWAIPLAQETGLRVIAVAGDAASAGALRERLLTTTVLFGSRIHVFEAPRDGRLPFAQFFAGAVIRVGDGAGVAPAELYRVLRPAGGVMLCLDLNADAAQAFLQSCGAPAAEMSRIAAAPAIVRGPLPGAADWNSPTLSDRYLKGPLRPLWFGGPGPMESYDRLTGYPTITAAGGRYYYLVRGSLVAADAYSGVKLWERPAPLELRPATLDGRQQLIPQDATKGYDQETVMAWRGQPAAIIGLTADADSVYLTLGKTCFRGQGPACIRIDARTGAQKAVYGDLMPASRVESLDAPRRWTIPVDDAHSGTIDMAAEAQGLTVDLSTRDPVVTPSDGWDLFFDFRPAAERFGLYDRGVFWLRVEPAAANGKPAACHVERGEAWPGVVLSGATQSNGTHLTVVLPWTNLARVASEPPRSFGFGAALRSHDGAGAPAASPKTPRDRQHAQARARPRTDYLFADALADALNNGWATIVLPGGADEAPAARRPSVLAGPLSTVPARFRESNMRLDYYLPDRDAQRRLRIHPLTGDVGPKMFIRGNGCGAIFSSAYCYYMRSSTVGVYDLLDDAGIWSFGGVRPSCGQNMLAAQGILLVADDLSACSCQYAFQTPFALAHAERRLEEDWRQFYDLPADNLVRLASINLAAPGDRRDADGTLWLGFPRFQGGNGALVTPGAAGRAVLNGVWPKMFGFSMTLPLSIQSAEGLGPYRFNADRTPIRNTDRPWLYASGYRGIQSAALTVDLRTPLVSRSMAVAPALDGRLEAGWGEPSLTLPNTRSRVTLRHDGQALYVAARIPALVDEKGQNRPWRSATKGEDAPVWDDDSLEYFLADRAATRVAHLGVSVSGARFEALAAPGDATEDVSWSAPWKSAVATDGGGFTVELAIPLAELKAAGLDADALSANVQVNQRVDTADRRLTQGEALCFLGGRGRRRCLNFMPLGLGSAPTLAPRSFAVRLHFAEPDVNAKPGDRVFDILLQGQTVLKGLDVVREAGAPRAALVKEFGGVTASNRLTVSFASAADALTASNAPVLCALEVRDESYRPPDMPAAFAPAGAAEPDIDAPEAMPDAPIGAE